MIPFVVMLYLNIMRFFCARGIFARARFYRGCIAKTQQHFREAFDAFLLRLLNSRLSFSVFFAHLLRCITET